jgi:hypothetical protein
MPFHSTARYEDASGGVGSMTTNASGTSSPTDLVASDTVGTGGILGTGAGIGTGPESGQAFGLGLNTMQLCERWGFQGSVYLTTGTVPSFSASSLTLTCAETSLPQVMQTLGPSSNAIILVPTPGYPAGSGGSTLEYAQAQGLDIDGCQCQTMGWMSCPLHSMG